MLALGLAAFLVSAWAIDHFRFDPTAVLVSRALTYTVVAAALVQFLIRPLLVRVSDERVALYLEESEPSLQAAVVSGVELGRSGDAISPDLARRVIETALERCRAVEYGRRIERRSVTRSSGVLAGLATAGLALVLFEPAFLVNSAAVILSPWRGADDANPYRIDVTPGDADLARGADQRVSARLVGFESDQVEIVVRRGEAAEWERWAMSADPESGEFLFLLFDLNERTDYFVESSGVRSPVHRIEVSDLPYVERIDLEYRYPEYTGLEPDVIEDGGDIVALRGTEVQLAITPTMESPSGRLVVEGEDPVSLRPEAGGGFSVTLTVEREAFYTIELEAWNGRLVEASPEYAITVLRDQAPAVRFSRPGSDARATSIEEFFAEVEAEDDYGVRSVELVFAVNGGEEETVSLYRGGRQQVTAGHTFFLEEYGLVPGDFISYYARARDTDQVDGPHTTTTDIYFLEIRPFDQEYRQAEQSAVPGGGGQSPESALSERQREIVAATFKLIRDRREYTNKEFEENVNTVELAQARLREQVEALLQRLRNRGASMDSGFVLIAEALPIAIEEMRAAEEQLDDRQPDTALVPEQRALQQLLRAEAAFREVQVAFNQGGGGGGGPGPNAEDLADLFELELDKLRNQYEAVQRGREEQARAEVDELTQRLQELARRQQQMNERMRRQLGNPGAQAGGSAQAQLIEETEQLARRLERLARERSSPDLQRTARQLQEAADAMRRSSEGSAERGLASGISALDRLQEARRLIEEDRSDQLEGSVQTVLDQVRRLRQQEERLVEDVDEAVAERDRSEAMNRVLERKAAMSAEVGELEQELDRLANQARAGEERDASRGLRAAAQSIRQNRLEEKIRYSMGVVQSGEPEYARSFEQEIASNIEELERRVEEAAGAMRGEQEEELARSLDRAQDLVRGLESLQDRIDERASGRRLDPRAGAGAATEQGEASAQGAGQPGEATAEGGAGQDGEGEGPGAAGAQGERQQGGMIGGPSDGRGGPVRGLEAEDVRQFRREFAERRGEAEALRQELARQGVDVSALAEVIAGMRALDDARVYGDLAEIERLQATVIRGLKEFEYALRRELDADEERLFLSGSDQVPEGYREMVEKYYRSLAESR